MNIKENLENNNFTVTMENENMAESEQQQAIEYLKSLNPAIFNSGEINLNALKETLGLDVNNTTKGYGLSFLGKNLVQSLANRKSEYELKEEITQSKNSQTTENLILRGDNIDSLKLLNNSYKNKIKCIYIDPPYNTDSDNFVYNDSFKENEKNLIDDLDLDEKDVERLGREFNNKKSHNGWLTFMYPRLKLARKLLTEDGVIFISIDDNEQANLKLLCDEIFGENNFLGSLPTVMNLKGNNDEYGFAGTHEFTLLYLKNKGKTEFNNLIIKDENEIKKEWKIDDHGYYKLGTLKAGGENGRREKRQNLFFPLYIDPISLSLSLEKDERHNHEILPLSKEGEELTWRWSVSKILNEPHNIDVSMKDSVITVQRKIRAKNNVPSTKPKTLLYKPEYSSGNGIKVIKSLFNKKKVFSYTKPIYLVEDLLQITTNANDIIIDFFAGSGTTAHSVMQLNTTDNGNRKFILCQLDESLNKKNKEAISFCKENDLEKVISSITIERVNRAGEQIKQDLITQGKTEQANNLDIGYKVFSHVKAPTIEIDENSLQANMNLQQPTTTQDRLTNMMLKTGVQLNQPIEPIQDDCLFKINNNYYIINSEKLENKNLEQILKQANQDPDELNNIYIDGYTATINTTLQQYHKNIKAIL